MATRINGVSTIGSSLSQDPLREVTLSTAEQIEERIYAVNDDPMHPLHKPVRKAISVIEQALDRHGQDSLGLSFNGGKDCTVILELLTAVLSRRSNRDAVGLSEKPALRDRTASAASIQSICVPMLNDEPIATLYATVMNPFPEEDHFVSETSARYNLDIVRVNAPMRKALEIFLEQRPHIKAILVGTRRNDPHGAQLSDFDMTDPKWPQVLRVHPILDWSYANVWSFLVDMEVAHCKLYDLGYTSLGGTDNTIPNPRLKNPDRACGYDPAWLLTDEQYEREGRT